MSSPLHTVKKDFGSKDALVDKLMPLLDRDADESEEEFKDRLMRVSNRKLLRLWSREQDLRSRFGSREALVDQIVEMTGGDADNRRKLLDQGTGQLLSIHWGHTRSANR